MAEDTHLQAHTTIEFSDAYAEDGALLDDEVLSGRRLERILHVVDPLRDCAHLDYRFRMRSHNDFPTQAGLASSASGYAALALAAVAALGLEFSKEEISTYARLGSGSAARSIHGGFVYWHQGDSHETSYAEQICGPDDFDMRLVIAIISEGPKEVTSDVGHESAHTSPFNEVRIRKSQAQAQELRRALLNDDFTAVGKIAEENCKYMHAVMMTSSPPLFYWQPGTLRVVKSVQSMRKGGLECYFTVDAGPNVHCLCRSEDASELQKMLGEMECVKKTIPASPADDSYVTQDHLF
jgi:diphosphomevalonate decarboxylase